MRHERLQSFYLSDLIRVPLKIHVLECNKALGFSDESKEKSGCWSAGKAIFQFSDEIPNTKMKRSWQNHVFRSPLSLICHHSNGSLSWSSQRTQVLHWTGQLLSHNIQFSGMLLAPSARPSPFWATNTTSLTPANSTNWHNLKLWYCPRDEKITVLVCLQKSSLDSSGLPQARMGIFCGSSC